MFGVARSDMTSEQNNVGGGRRKLPPAAALIWINPSNNSPSPVLVGWRWRVNLRPPPPRRWRETSEVGWRRRVKEGAEETSFSPRRSYNLWADQREAGDSLLTRAGSYSADDSIGW